MKKDLRKVLENGKEYLCTTSKNGHICLFYCENGKGNIYEFDDIKHDGYLSKMSYFEIHEQMILVITSFDFINFETGNVTFTGKILYD